MQPVLCHATANFLFPAPTGGGDPAGVLLSPHGVMARTEQHALGGMPNADTLLRDQFIEHVLDSSL